MTVKTKSLILSFSLLLGITALALALTLIPKSQETRRRAAEVAPICWNVVREFESKPQWPNGCKGNPTPQYCTQALVPLTDEETAIYSAWVDAGKPAIEGCTLVKIRGPQTILEGYFDGVDTGNNKIFGWSFDKADTSATIPIEIYIDDTLVTTITADQPRNDVNVAFSIEGNHGFFYPIPNSYMDGQEHTVTVKSVGLDGQTKMHLPSTNPVKFTLLNPPTNLTATCAYSGKEVTLAWDTVPSSDVYLLRINDPRNDTQSCADGWLCADPPDKLIDTLTANSYIHAGIIPGQNYRAWVHAHLADSSINSETTGIDFTCPSPITGDINLDKIVDISDYSLLVNQILKLDADLTADLNQDSKIDMSDYSLLVTNFGQTRP